jgi:mono/diheme cytochrome c family protein
MLKRFTQTATLVLVAFIANQTSFAQASGADTFKTKCAMCHGDDGLGNTAMGKALGIQSYKDPAVIKLSNAELTAIIKNGKNNKMPAFNGQVTDSQIKDLLQYIHKLQK